MDRMAAGDRTYWRLAHRGASGYGWRRGRGSGCDAPAFRLAGLSALKAHYAATAVVTQSGVASMIAWFMASAHRNRLPAPLAPSEISAYGRVPEAGTRASYAVGPITR